MLKALVIKELRESAGIVALGVLGAAYALADLTGMRLFPWQAYRVDGGFPFVGGNVLVPLAVVGGGLAIMLGFKQSAWELWHNSYYFLLHRPASRQQIFATKLAVGICVLWLLTAALMLAYAAWAATPGNSATPFFWSMTGAAWQVWFALPLLYLGAFLSGIRPGRWFGSRLLPLAAGVAVVMVGGAATWWWVGIGIVIISAAIYLVSILQYVQTRDY